MPRNLDTLNAEQTTAYSTSIAFFLEITFKSMTCYATSLPFSYEWNGQTWLGVGSMGSVQTISEGLDVNAYGTAVTLSGIDPVLLPECLTDIQIGAPATLYMAFIDENMNVIGTPTPLFAGQVDQPSIKPGTDTVSITLNLESPLIRLQQGSYMKLTDADQRALYPNDSAFLYVSLLAFQALRWGS